MATFELTSTYPSQLIDGDILTCKYSGSSVCLDVPAGKYKIECYGAQGGYADTAIGAGGKGGYSCGTITFNNATTLFLFVGEQGATGGGATFNGGGGSGLGTAYGGSGGGASDVRLGGLDTDQRIIVAGGGGGGSILSSNSGILTAAAGGTGGGSSGGAGKVGGTYDDNYYAWGGDGGTLTSGGDGGYALRDTSEASAGILAIGGQGKNVTSLDDYTTGTGGGGGGYYGGGGGTYSYLASARYAAVGAGGGSGYISSDFTDVVSENGLRSGDGYIVITVIKLSTKNNTLYCKIEGSWKEQSKIFAKKGGHWNEVSSLNVRVNDKWINDSESSAVGTAYAIYQKGMPLPENFIIEDCSEVIDPTNKAGYSISDEYGIEIYAGESVIDIPNVQLGGLAVTSKGECKFYLNGIDKNGRLYVSSYAQNISHLKNDSYASLSIMNSGESIFEKDVSEIANTDVVEILNPNNVTIKVTACAYYMSEPLRVFITNISYQEI